MTGEMKALRASISPVQGFIAAGRRTRDFWAGSFLLSLLSGTAMDEVIKQNGRVTIPAVYNDKDVVEEKTLKAIDDARKRGIDAEGYVLPEDTKLWRGPMAGTLVNHFRAEVRADFDPQKMTDAVHKRFQAIANEVFDHFIKPTLDAYAAASGGNRTEREIKRKEIETRWEVQTDGSYFEILWVSGPDDGDWEAESRWLDRRKTARIHLPIDEFAAGLPGTGDRCPVYGDLCELGGFSRIHEGDKQNKFWEILRETVGKKMYSGVQNQQFRDTLEIREDEHLSGLALVKRLFPLLCAKAIARSIGWVPDYDFDIGTPSIDWSPDEAQRTLRNWPSTAFIAAIPWIVVAGRCAPKDSEEYANKQYSKLGASPLFQSERPQRHRIDGIDQLDKVLGKKSGKPEVPFFAVLDGTLHFKRGLEKHRFVKWSKIVGKTADGGERARAETLANELAANFETFIEKAGAPIKTALAKMGVALEVLKKKPAAPFYAMLEMDGDGMGEIFSTKRPAAEQCSKALLDFSVGVAKIVRDHDGVLIYAGADDVAAMLPIDTAISCACAIREFWKTKFPETGGPTLSASIVFADHQNALDDVRALTHNRLDGVAKDGMGRDALALAVMKSGGPTAEWASCWEGCDDPANRSKELVRPPRELFDYAKAAQNKKTIASRLPYVIQDRFRPILADDASFDDKNLSKFIAKELSDSGLSVNGASDEEKKSRITEWADRVVKVLRPYRRDSSKTKVKAPRHVGGMLIARFLVENVFWPYLQDREARRGGNGKSGGQS